MANLIVEAVRPDQTGVATGMNAVMRTIGGAIGGQVAASLLAATLLADGLPGENGYTLSFASWRSRSSQRSARRSPSPAATGARSHLDPAPRATASAD